MAFVLKRLALSFISGKTNLTFLWMLLCAFRLSGEGDGDPCERYKDGDLEGWTWPSVSMLF